MKDNAADFLQRVTRAGPLVDLQQVLGYVVRKGFLRLGGRGAPVEQPEGGGRKDRRRQERQGGAEAQEFELFICSCGSAFFRLDMGQPISYVEARASPGYTMEPPEYASESPV